VFWSHFSAILPINLSQTTTILRTIPFWTQCFVIRPPNVNWRADDTFSLYLAFWSHIPRFCQESLLQNPKLSVSSIAHKFVIRPIHRGLGVSEPDFRDFDKLLQKQILRIHFLSSFR
jgi:hypothetical protein